MTKLKVGDRLWRVYDGIGDIELQAVTIKRITSEYAWFYNDDDKRHSGGLAFDCRTRLELQYAEKCTRTPEAAIKEFLTTKEQAVVGAQRELKEAKEWAASAPKDDDE